MCLEIQTYQQGGFLVGNDKDVLLGVKTFIVDNNYLCAAIQGSRYNVPVRREGKGFTVTDSLNEQDVNIYFNTIISFNSPHNGHEIVATTVKGLGMHIQTFYTDSFKQTPRKVVRTAHVDRIHNIPVMFYRWNIQLMDDTSVVVRSLIIPNPALLIKLFPEYPIEYYTEYETVWEDTIKTIKENKHVQS